MEVGLSLGSNIGNRATHLAEARRRIGQISGVTVVAQSPLYETDPVGVKPEFEHLKFLNAVLIVETTAPVEQLHAELSRIEKDFGRTRSDDRFAPRIIDIDVLYAGTQESRNEKLTLPHPRWDKRRFVLQPLLDVRPALKLPGTEQTISELLQSLPAGENVALFKRDW